MRFPESGQIAGVTYPPAKTNRFMTLATLAADLDMVHYKDVVPNVKSRFML